MSGWLWLLLFATFFYLMMRFGCGAHMVHGGHDNHGGGPEGHAGHGIPSGPANDPVCGMSVDPSQGYSKMYQGREYRFCSRKCLDKFDADPQQFLS